ncbi:phosphatase PAP2 family protein [Methanosarcina sp. Mfa9]|uniref:phosphatase PAP2 family protein n=1 Tax=Methanosarcina sp. Mfa9 TaxID=3439063 RepID=UPI003F8747E4
MFQTEPILYLQSLASDWLTSLMVLVTSMGSSSFYAAIIIAITFGIDFRRGILLFQLLLWTGAITEVLKVVFAMPRPYYVDSRVLNLESGEPNLSPFTGKGASSFFGLPDREVLETFRAEATAGGSYPFYALYGFPSGHVSTTTALWGGAALVFGRKVIWKIIPAVVLLMAFTRMYLGRHFLGDVIGGAFLGLLLLIAFSGFLQSPVCKAFFRKESFFPATRSPNILFYAFMFIIPLLLTASALIGPDLAGFLTGTNAAYLLVIRKGLPNDAGSRGKRISRVLVALLNFAAAAFITAVAIDITGAASSLGPNMIEFTEAFVPAFTVWVSVEICFRLGLYGKENFSGYNRENNA